MCEGSSYDVWYVQCNVCRWYSPIFFLKEIHGPPRHSLLLLDPDDDLSSPPFASGISRKLLFLHEFRITGPLRDARTNRNVIRFLWLIVGSLSLSFSFGLVSRRRPRKEGSTVQKKRLVEKQARVRTSRSNTRHSRPFSFLPYVRTYVVVVYRSGDDRKIVYPNVRRNRPRGSKPQPGHPLLQHHTSLDV